MICKNSKWIGACFSCKIFSQIHLRLLFLPVLCCVVLSHFFMPEYLQPHRLQPATLFCPWNSPGKSTGVPFSSFFFVSHIYSFLSSGLISSFTWEIFILKFFYSSKFILKIDIYQIKAKKSGEIFFFNFFKVSIRYIVKNCEGSEILLSCKPVSSPASFNVLWEDASKTPRSEPQDIYSWKSGHCIPKPAGFLVSSD